MVELTKDVEHALEWLATEFKYLKHLHSDLQRIEGEDVKKQEKELKKDRKIVRYIGRAERRLEKDVKDIVEEIKEAKKTEISEDRVMELLDQIEIPANQLVKEGSLYVGALKEQLNSIRTNVRLEEKYPTARMQKKLRNEIEKLDSEVRKVMTWLVALDAALKKVKSLGNTSEERWSTLECLKNLEEEYSERIEKVKEVKDLTEGKRALDRFITRLQVEIDNPQKMKEEKGVTYEHLIYLLKRAKRIDLKDVDSKSRLVNSIYSILMPIEMGLPVPPPKNRWSTKTCLSHWYGNSFGREVNEGLRGKELKMHLEEFISELKRNIGYEDKMPEEGGITYDDLRKILTKAEATDVNDEKSIKDFIDLYKSIMK
jgi:hypothetical protein